MVQKLNLNKIKGAMAENGLTQEALGKHMNLSSRTISLKLNGKVKITSDDLTLLSKILNKEIGYFFTFEVQK